MIRAIVLDLDGPLLDGIHRHYQCYSDILKEHGFEPVSLHQYWKMKRNRVNRRQLLSLSDCAGLYDDFLTAWIARIEAKEYLILDRLQNHAIEILRDWKESGVSLLLATLRNNPVNLYWQLDKFGISHFFDKVVVVGNGQADTRKSENIKPLLGNLHLEEVLWIGDTEVDIHSARELGVKVCALTCGLRTEEYLASLSPDMLEKNLNTFARGRLQI